MQKSKDRPFSDTIEKAYRCFISKLLQIEKKLNKYVVASSLDSSISWICCEQIANQSHEARWNIIPPENMHRPLFTIVAVTYQNIPALCVFLQAFNCQTCRDFCMHILHDGIHPETERTIDRMKPHLNYHLELTVTKERYNDWGHSLRSLALPHIDTEFIVFTNADNYYIPRFVEYVAAAISRYGLDLVYWDMIHSHPFPGGRTLHDYSLFKTRPSIRNIDIGAFAVRSSIAKRVGFTHASYDADGLFLQDLLATTEIRRIGYIDKVLLVHN